MGPDLVARCRADASEGPGVADHELSIAPDCAGDIAVGKSTSGVLSPPSIGSVFYASMSAFGGKGENMCSHRAFPVLTHLGHNAKRPAEALTIAGRYTGRVISKVQPFEVVSVSRRLPP
jgi:hypothetical protein